MIYDSFSEGNGLQMKDWAWQELLIEGGYPMTAIELHELLERRRAKSMGEERNEEREKNHRENKSKLNG